MRLVLAPLVLLCAAPASAALSPDELARAVARPVAGARLPAGLRFTDQRGAATTLGAVAAGRPLVLLFADYTCRHVCGPGLALTAGALHDSGLVAGADYYLAVIGIDAKDGVEAARSMGRNIGVADVQRATTLLVGNAPTIAAAMRGLGYGAVYDAETDQYAHDASVYVFSADGKLATLLPELGLRPEALKAALTAPPRKADDPAPSFAEQVAHLCYGFAAAHGRYGRPIVLAMQAASLSLLGFVGLFLWRRRRA